VQWVGIKFQALRELIPGAQMSDEATALYLQFLTAIAQEIGHDAFNALIERAVLTCERRPTIAQLRRMAGLVIPEIPSPAAKAWDLVTEIVTRHLGYDSQGNAYIKPQASVGEGLKLHYTPVPPIPRDVSMAVRAMGGWTNLAEAYPAYWHMRYKDFREIYTPGLGTLPAKKPALLSAETPTLG
jgi:hypothetical protein